MKKIKFSDEDLAYYELLNRSFAEDWDSKEDNEAYNNLGKEKPKRKGT